MGTDANRLAQARYREKNRERLNQYQRDRKLALRQEALRQYGDKCNRCGYNEDHRALQIDHIDNDGAEERKSGRDWVDRSSPDGNFMTS